MFPAFSMSSKYSQLYPGAGFGLALISNCQDNLNPEGFDQYKRKLLRKMRKRETLTRITERINIYADFFQRFGFYRKKFGVAGCQIGTRNNELLAALPPVTYECGIISGNKSVDRLFSWFLLPGENR